MSQGFDAPPRHTLVWIDPEAWCSEIGDWPALATDPLVAGWASRPWPLVVRRRRPIDRSGFIALGLPLPPSHGKRRVAVEVPATAVLSIRPPLTLVDVRDGAPQVWRHTIDALLELAKAHDIEPRVIGSFAWACLTGLDYVGATSDLDLLWPLTSRTPDLLPRLMSIERAAPGRLDGEILNEDGAAANWRELLCRPATVLVKTLTDVRLVDSEGFLRSATVAT